MKILSDLVGLVFLHVRVSVSKGLSNTGTIIDLEKKKRFNSTIVETSFGTSCRLEGNDCFHLLDVNVYFGNFKWTVSPGLRFLESRNYISIYGRTADG
jgi:hypothetical protein